MCRHRKLHFQFRHCADSLDQYRYRAVNVSQRAIKRCQFAFVMPGERYKVRIGAHRRPVCNTKNESDQSTLDYGASRKYPAAALKPGSRNLARGVSTSVRTISKLASRR
jgi:hypothetical protein